MAGQLNTSCALCGGTLGRVLLEITRPDRFERHMGVTDAGYTRRWVECAKCGAATNMAPVDAAARLATIAAGYYDIDLAMTSVAEKFVRIMSMPKLESDNAHRVDRILSFLGHGDNVALTPARVRRGSSPSLRVVDIGAGTGVFLAKLGQRATEHEILVDAWAIEPDSTAAAHLRSLPGVHVIEASYSPALGLADFDLCTLNKVLEHVPNPCQLVADLGPVLTEPGGVLYIEVPDVSTITYRPPDDNILGALHQHLYTSAALHHLADATGFVILQLSRVFEPSGKISLVAFLVSRDAVRRMAMGAMRS